MSASYRAFNFTSSDDNAISTLQPFFHFNTNVPSAGLVVYEKQELNTRREQIERT